MVIMVMVIIILVMEAERSVSRGVQEVIVYAEKMETFGYAQDKYEALIVLNKDVP